MTVSPGPLLNFAGEAVCYAAGKQELYGQRPI